MAVTKSEKNRIIAEHDRNQRAMDELIFDFEFHFAKFEITEGKPDFTVNLGTKNGGQLVSFDNPEGLAKFVSEWILDYYGE